MYILVQCIDICKSWVSASCHALVLPFPYQLPLTWESAQVLLEFYHPSFLPAVEENKTLTPEVASHLLTTHTLTCSHCPTSVVGVSVSETGPRHPRHRER